MSDAKKRIVTDAEAKAFRDAVADRIWRENRTADRDRAVLDLLDTRDALIAVLDELVDQDDDGQTAAFLGTTYDRAAALLSALRCGA